MSYFDSIYADTLLPPRAVSVYMYLKDRSNSAGSCWPGIKTIARDMNLSRSTVKRALADLEQHGYGWLTFNVRHGINIPSPMLFTFLIELIPVFMAVYLVSQAPSGKLTAALRQLPLPSSVRLTVIVILRFVPTVASEFSDVLDAMKTRGLLLSPLQVVLHPLNTFEYVVVPMVFRSLKIADELAASSVVRGIESPYKKEGYYLNKMAVSDGVMIALFISTAAMCVLV